MIYLSSVRLKKGMQQKDNYPFNIPLIKNLNKIEFNTPVTFLVGENGTGKSTILEAIAANINHISIGENDIEKDKTLIPARELGKYIQVSWKLRTHKGFYLRAEDVFGFTKKLATNIKELDEFVNEIDKTSSGYGNFLARNAVLGQKKGYELRYGNNLDNNSHGETFLKIFQARFVPGGLYILDEPDTPLSFKKQLALLFIIQRFVKQDAQFIIATHSPILTTLPDSKILSIENGNLEQVLYDEVEQFSLMKDFLNHPQSYLNHLDNDPKP